MLELTNLAGLFGAKITAILGLIAADVILAVAVAIKDKRFDWQQLADFFQTMIVPKLLGWLAASVLARFVSSEYLIPPFDVLGPGIDTIAFTAVVVSLASSIIKHFQSLTVIEDDIPF